MATNATSTFLKVAALGGGAYLAYEYYLWYQGQASVLSSFLGPSAASAVPAAAPAVSGGGVSPAPQTPGTPPAAVAPASVPTAPMYSGPSLDQMYAALVTAVAAGYTGGDTAVTCQGMSGLGIAGGVRSATPVSSVLGRPRPVGIPNPRTLPGASTTPAAPVSCSVPMATPDVWNWYLVNRANVGVSVAPSSTDMGLDPSTPITGSAYWAAAAPVLRQRIPGLSGLGAFGLAFYRGIRRRRSPSLAGFGQADLSALQNLPESTYAGASGGVGPANVPLFDLPALTTFTQLPTGELSASSTLSTPGVSTGVLVLGGGALLLLAGVMAGARR